VRPFRLLCSTVKYSVHFGAFRDKVKDLPPFCDSLVYFRPPEEKAQMHETFLIVSVFPFAKKYCIHYPKGGLLSYT
jgi:hypothetical protein